jgi:hypothetical protein
MSQLLDPDWERASILPVGRNRKTGKLGMAVPQVAADLLSALMLPGDVYQGNVLMNDPATGHTSDEVIRRSADLASNLTLGTTGATGAARLAKGERLVDPNTVNIFAGEGARTADHAALKVAQEMAEKGAYTDEILDATGWFRGADGKWRFEIDDSKSTLKAGDLTHYGWMGNFGEALDHPALAEAYPDMQNIPTDIRKTGSKQGEYFNYGGYEKINVGDTDMDSARSTLLHEAQHAVQQREGFAMGGNVKTIDLTPYRDEIMMMAKSEHARGVPLGDAMARAERAKRFELYKRLAGETEARNVEKRRNMTAEERHDLPYGWTQDYDDAMQTIRFR